MLCDIILMLSFAGWRESHLLIPIINPPFAYNNRPFSHTFFIANCQNYIDTLSLAPKIADILIDFCKESEDIYLLFSVFLFAQVNLNCRPVIDIQPDGAFLISPSRLLALDVLIPRPAVDIQPRPPLFYFSEDIFYLRIS